MLFCLQKKINKYERIYQLSWYRAHAHRRSNFCLLSLLCYRRWQWLPLRWSYLRIGWTFRTHYPQQTHQIIFIIHNA